MRFARFLTLAVLVASGGCGVGDSSPPVDAEPGSNSDASTTGADASSTVDAAGVGDALTPNADASPEPTTIEATYRVLHWNIAGGKENNCQTPGITDAVLQFVQDKNIDFVGLNEVCRAQYRSIQAALRQHWGKGSSAKFSAYVGDEIGRIVGNAILSRFNIRGVTRLKLGEDQYGTRNLLCAKVAAQPHLRFCSTHLTPGDPAARRQMGKALDRIEQWWKDQGDTVILSGDINLRADDRGLNTVYAPGANHPDHNPNNQGRYRELDDADPDHCLGYGERSLPGTAGGPCSEGGKIDFIFVRRNRIVDGRYAGDTLNIPSTCTGVCSDHRPVFGRVRVRIRVD